MIYQKGNMWKAAGSSEKYATEAEAKAAAGIKETVIKESPLDQLRGLKQPCNECACDPCECDEEWKSADET